MSKKEQNKVPNNGVNEVLKPVHPCDIVGKWFDKLTDGALGGAKPYANIHNLNDDTSDPRDLDNPERSALEVGLKWTF